MAGYKQKEAITKAQYQIRSQKKKRKKNKLPTTLPPLTHISVYKSLLFNILK